MTTETSRNPDYASFAQTSREQAPIPQSVHNLPGTSAANSSVSTSLVKTDGFTLISAGITVTQNGTLSIQRYLDDGGVQIQGAAISIAVTANTPANLDILDGKPFSSFLLTITNSTASAATISSFALLAQTSAPTALGTGVSLPVSLGNAGADGSTTITTGGTAQLLFGGVAPTNGFSVYNPDSVNDLWVSDSTTAAANGTGSIRVAANGGGYETPVGYKPIGSISVVGATTGQKISARRW